MNDISVLAADEICLNDDEKEFKIPLVQFCEHLSFWKDVPEIKFIVHKKNVTTSAKMVIKNLRIE